MHCYEEAAHVIRNLYTTWAIDSNQLILTQTVPSVYHKFFPKFYQIVTLKCPAYFCKPHCTSHAFHLFQSRIRNQITFDKVFFLLNNKFEQANEFREYWI